MNKKYKLARMNKNAMWVMMIGHCACIGLVSHLAANSLLVGLNKIGVFETEIGSAMWGLTLLVCVLIYTLRVGSAVGSRYMALILKHEDEMIDALVNRSQTTKSLRDVMQDKGTK